MNYITLILIVALLLGLSDFFTERIPKIQQTMYAVSFMTIYALFTIKYFYGADMLNYYNYYIWAPSVHDVWHHPADFIYEQGYTMLCSLLHRWNVSFYWFTVIISTIYFLAIYCLFRHIPRKRSLALMMLVVLDYNLIFAAFRQCLSVGIFIFFLLALNNKKYICSAVFAVLTMWLHKSGVFAVSIGLFFYLIRAYRANRWVYAVLLGILCCTLLIPLTHISDSLIHFFPSSVVDSVTHHLQLGRQVQSVFVLYFMLLLCLAYYHHFGTKTSMRTMAAIAILGCVTVVIFYKYYYLLNRIRSYFIPVIITYAFTYIQQTEDSRERSVPYGKLLKQLACCLFFVYAIHMTYSFTCAAAKMSSPIYRACTVFDLVHHSAKDVQKRQIQIAEKWWKNDFQRGLKNNNLN